MAFFTASFHPLIQEQLTIFHDPKKTELEHRKSALVLGCIFNTGRPDLNVERDIPRAIGYLHYAESGDYDAKYRAIIDFGKTTTQLPIQAYAAELLQTIYLSRNNHRISEDSDYFRCRAECFAQGNTYYIKPRSTTLLCSKNTQAQYYFDSTIKSDPISVPKQG